MGSGNLVVGQSGGPTAVINCSLVGVVEESLRHTGIGSSRRKVSPADYERILEVFRAHDIRYFLYIGGNDSIDTARRVDSLARAQGYELQVVGIPKTVDNDLFGTDHCPGYGSAARYVARAVLDISVERGGARGLFMDHQGGEEVGLRSIC